MSPRIETATGATRCILSTVQRGQYLKIRSIPSATCIRSSIPEILRSMPLRRAIGLGRSCSERLFLNP